MLIYCFFCLSLKALYSLPHSWWFYFLKKFYLDVLNGVTKSFTSKVSLSIPSEFPVTDLRLGPRKTKNFFIFSVTYSRSPRMPTIYLHLSTRGAGTNSHLSSCSSSIEAWVLWNSKSQFSSIVFPWRMSYLAAANSCSAFSDRLNSLVIWMLASTLSAI